MMRLVFTVMVFGVMVDMGAEPNSKPFRLVAYAVLAVAWRPSPTAARQ
jgi:fatty acid/phospholipid biosynthesis enzyme